MPALVHTILAGIPAGRSFAREVGQVVGRPHQAMVLFLVITSGEFDIAAPNLPKAGVRVRVEPKCQDYPSGRRAPTNEASVRIHSNIPVDEALRRVRNGLGPLDRVA